MWYVIACAGLHVAPALGGEFQDLSVDEALQRLKRRGLDILYSSDLIKPSMIVRREPQGTEPRAILEEILRPYGVAIRDGPNGRLLLVRDPLPRSAGTAGLPKTPAKVQRAALEEILVSASRYELVRDLTFQQTWISTADMQALPTLGDDALRAAGRLPGVAASDFSAKVNIRGGAADETLVRFDGLRLEDPFHLKDFQSTFSAIGTSIVDGMRVHTGGFPVMYGDRMSGVIDVDPISIDEPPHNELAVSFFNTSLIVAGKTPDQLGEWLLSARRGNLDLLIDAVGSDVGRPSYADFYGRARRPVSDSLTLAANALVSDDAVALFNSDQEEHARASFRDEYYWIRADYAPTSALRGNVLVARARMESHRRGRADQEGVSRGRLSDERSFDINSLQSDWIAHLPRDVLVQFGGEWRDMRGRYDYRDEVDFELLFDTPGAPTEPHRSRALRVRPNGSYYAAYANVRVEPLPVLALDLGVRWDHQTLSTEANDAWNPRIGLVYSLMDRTRLRASWGRYSQSQSITELQVADGVADFFPPQRAEHLIASIEREFANGIEARLELYRKDYTHVRPRFENLLNSFILLPELKPDRIRIAPTGARVTGAELTLKGHVRPSVDWWFNYAWASAKDEFGTEDTPRTWDQRNVLTGGFTWRNDAWELSVRGTYHTGWPTTQSTLLTFEPSGIATTGPRNDSHLRDYRSIDLRAARTFRLEGESVITTFVEINNVLNRTNQCCVEYELERDELDMARRSYLPIVPSLGVVWRF